LYAVHGIGRKFAVLREEAQGREAATVLVKNLQRLAPRGLLAVVDFAQIQHRPMHDLRARHAPTLDDAEITMFLAVLFASMNLQVHAPECQTFAPQKRG